jgi:hypothetical protein
MSKIMEFLHGLDPADWAVGIGFLLNLIATVQRRQLATGWLVRMACVVKALGPHLADAAKYAVPAWSSLDQCRAYLGMAPGSPLPLPAPEKNGDIQ